ncbi:glycosyltransferase [Pseudodesulfovibrio cashew]|uniref:Glycosyltransferase n=1 Tax=Pseudodesulfovibrio cashew TaxID=2678688 RepID=A0A6I6JRE9_9BACT|nr:TIGR04283 family arsenosugar biosynthesis glycosyltransferase [Pseudodesulfovibrio cashew]QGY40174.1 glycosyltransferase [Pseudodesulfovibrio cashew]
MDRNTTTRPSLSVIIPVYNEAEIINDAIQRVRRAATKEPVEIVVADGGPGHDTLAAVRDPDVIKVACPPGRGIQLNAGADRAGGDTLLFLHADTRLPGDAFTAIRRAVADGAAAGAFSLSIDSPRPSLRVVALFANLRTRLERVPYGDQAQFVTAQTFRALGGFAAIPIMEDVEFFRRIRRQGLPIAILPGKVVTSARRWEKEGVLVRTLTNWWLRLRYALGADPADLARHYRPQDAKDAQ